MWILGLQTYSLFFWRFINFVFYFQWWPLKKQYILSQPIRHPCKSIDVIFTAHVCICVYNHLHKRWRAENFTWCHKICFTRLHIGKSRGWKRVSAHHKAWGQRINSLVLCVPHSHVSWRFGDIFLFNILIIHTSLASVIVSMQRICVFFFHAIARGVLLCWLAQETKEQFCC